MSMETLSVYCYSTFQVVDHLSDQILIKLDVILVIITLR